LPTLRKHIPLTFPETSVHLTASTVGRSAASSRAFSFTVKHTLSKMVRKLLLTAPLLLVALSLAAQLPDPCPSNQEPPADNCSDACIYCNFNGMMSSSAGYGPGAAPGFCGSIENEQWLGFIAGAGSATFTATPSNCTNGNGIQIALYASCGGAGPIACNGGSQGGGNNPVSINAALTPGANYFLLIDGWAGDQCNFTITVTPPAAVQAPPIGNTIGNITGPSPLCPGATATYTVPPVTNAGGYIWTVPPGWLVNGDPGPLTVIAPGGNTVQITAGPNTGNNFQICVQAANSCYPDGPTRCRTIPVQNIPPTVLQPAVVCFEDAPYTLPWGDEALSTGTYQTVFQSYLGCDSIVRQNVTVKPALVTFLFVRTSVPPFVAKIYVNRATTASFASLFKVVTVLSMSAFRCSTPLPTFWATWCLPVT
jgi:hypothetical protein